MGLMRTSAASLLNSVQSHSHCIPPSHYMQFQSRDCSLVDGQWLPYAAMPTSHHVVVPPEYGMHLVGGHSMIQCYRGKTTCNNCMDGLPKVTPVNRYLHYVIYQLKQTQTNK